MGHDFNGVAHPFISAPGTAVLSSMNSYLSVRNSYAQQESNASGRNCYWGPSSGTSMSAPCVAGIVALWLQANPLLTIDQVKEVMANTANKEGITSDMRWGNGRIDAYEGILQVISSGVDEHGVAAVDIEMLTNGDVLTLVSSASSPFDITIYSMNGVVVASQRGQHRIDMNISHLDSGVYMLTAQSGLAKKVFKILKK